MITLSRITSMLFVLLMSFGLTACGGGESSSADSDKGSEAEIQDIDSDGDGVGDNADVFPYDASETKDTDGDGVGDNADAFPNDASETKDTDGDDVGDNTDAFPNDATETIDTDGDGVGDNVDVDDNGLIEISSLEQLDWIRNNLAGTSLDDGISLNSSDDGCYMVTGCNGYELTQDLDFDTNGDGVMDANDTYFDYDGDASNRGWLPIGTLSEPYIATFDGNGYEIMNLYINRPDEDYIGLFGYVGIDSTGFNSTGMEIRCLTGDLTNVTGNNCTGGLAGYLYVGVINSSYWATDASGQSEGYGQEDASNTIELTGVTLEQLKCPTSANNTSCLTDETLYAGWDAIDHDNDDTTDPISPWFFGDSNTLPSLSVE